MVDSPNYEKLKVFMEHAKASCPHGLLIIRQRKKLLKRPSTALGSTGIATASPERRPRP